MTTLPGEGTLNSILFVEDSVTYREFVGRHLKEWGLPYCCARDGSEAWKLLIKRNAPTLVLLDWLLPEVDGLELCRRIRNRTDSHYAYVILLTAKNRKQEMLEAMDAGADDFLAKPHDPLELRARLLVGLRIVELQQKLTSANATLRFMATHDFLTGAWNRGEIVSFMQRELARARRERTPLGFILVDVDNFKRINDGFGHESGDLVLLEITKRLSSSLREYDGMGRYSGEEFLLVVPGCDLVSTVRRANQIRELISDRPISTITTELTVTVSMGVSVAGPFTTSELLLRSVDQALYQAKRNGRNRVEHVVLT